MSFLFHTSRHIHPPSSFRRTSKSRFISVDRVFLELVDFGIAFVSFMYDALSTSLPHVQQALSANLIAAEKGWVSEEKEDR